MGQKKAKGEISIENNEGRIRLRWRYNGIRYPLNLPYTYTPENIHYATVKAAEINLDIMKGCFDTSLEKYKTPQASTSPIQTKPVNKEEFSSLDKLVIKFNDWCKNIRNVDVETSIDYLYLRRVLEKWVGVPIERTAKQLNDSNWAITTYNRRLTYLSSFYSWLVNTGVLKSNPLVDVKRRREKRKKRNPRRKPLEESEIVIFLNAIKDDTYCENPRYKHSHYYPFLAFVFHTGVRNAEAIGLKVKHVDFEAGHIEISEALARTIKGAHHTARVRKGTKTENVRYLPMSDSLKELLSLQVQGKASEVLVFPSPKGVSIDDNLLQRRILKPVLQQLGFDNRDLYAARHSFGTRAVQQGMALTDLAYLLGHSTILTAARNYVSVARPAAKLPTIKAMSN